MIERFRQWLAGTAAKALDLRMFPRWAQHSWPSIALRRLADEGYRKNSAVFACVRLWGNSFPEPRLQVIAETPDGRQPLPGHPLAILMQRPNRAMSESMLMGYAITYMAVGGNCYLYKERNNKGAVIGLWPLHDGQIRPVADPYGWLSHYAYDDEGTDIRVEASEIVQLMWAPDPLDPLRGLSPLVAAARSVDTDEAAQRYVFNLLRNDAVPLTVVTLKEPLGKSRLGELKAQFRDSFGGDQVGEPMFIEGDEASVARLGAAIGELAAEALHNIPESRIAAALEVPPVLVGLNIGLQRSIQGAPSELQEFWTETVRVPRWRAVADQLTLGLGADFGLDMSMTLSHDLSEVVALEGARERRASAVRADLMAGMITRNEARLAAGYSPAEAEDVYLVPSSAIETPIGGFTALPATDTSADAIAAELLGGGQASRNGHETKVLAGGQLTRRQEREKRELARLLEVELDREFAAMRNGVAGKV